MRGGGGLFYDRPDGNTVFSIPGNPPISTSQDLRNGNLQTLGKGLCPRRRAGADHVPVRREGPVLGAVERRRADGAAMVVVARRVRTSATRLQPARRVPGRQPVNLNAVDFGAAYLPQNQDPTLARSARPGRERATRRTCCGRIAASATSTQQHDGFCGHVPLDPDVFNRRFRTGGVRRELHARACRSTATPACSSACSTTPTARSRSAPTGAYEDLNKNLEPAAAHPQGQLRVGPAGRAGDSGGGKASG